MDKFKHPDTHPYGRPDHPDTVRHEVHETVSKSDSKDKDVTLTVKAKDEQAIKDADPRKPVEAVVGITPNTKDKNAEYSKSEMNRFSDPSKQQSASNTSANPSVQRAGEIVREVDKNDKDHVELTVATADSSKDADGKVRKGSKDGKVDAVILSGATRVSAEMKAPTAAITTPDGAVPTQLTPGELAERYASEHKTEPPSISGHVKVHAIKNGTYKGVPLKANDVFFVEHGDFDSNWMERV